MSESLGFAQVAEGSVVTVGSFDGVHLGHRAMLRRVRERAAERNLPAVLVTFRPHPLEVVNPSAAPLMLTPGEEQLDALSDSGPLLVVVIPFTAEFARLTAEEFITSVLVQRYQMREFISGYDHGLGRGRHADGTRLSALGAQLGFRVEIIRPTLDDAGTPYSSSSVRTSLSHGDLDRARAALGRPYWFRGHVVPGAQRGRDLGYPTLNIEVPSPRKLLPPEGVYAVRAQTSRGEFGGMMNLGARPTFGEFNRTVEVHLFGATGDWYGEAVSVEFIRRLRDTTRFESVDALIAQLAQDAEHAHRALTQA
jgi:riboflavin kinase / FMN adenylyltransferase